MFVSASKMCIYNNIVRCGRSHLPDVDQPIVYSITDPLPAGREVARAPLVVIKTTTE